jgi:uncharacterized protein YdeI (YjbR/CyaY-like superfamily)
VEITETILAADRDEWRAWLEANHDTAEEIWLVSPHKDTGRERVPYNDAVEEALCFGWIDSIVKKYGEDHSAQRYTPRREGSPYSQPNKERVARLREAGKIHASVLAQVDDVRPEEFEIPDDIIAALKAESGAWEFFSATSPSYQRIRAAYVNQYRPFPEEFEKRLASLVQKSAARKQFGYGIESYY